MDVLVGMVVVVHDKCWVGVTGIIDVVVAVGEGVPETGLANAASPAPRQPSSQHAGQPTAGPSSPADNK